MPTFTLQKVHVVPKKKFKIKIKKKKPFNLNNDKHANISLNISDTTAACDTSSNKSLILKEISEIKLKELINDSIKQDIGHDTVTQDTLQDIGHDTVAQDTPQDIGHDTVSQDTPQDIGHDTVSQDIGHDTVSQDIEYEDHYVSFIVLHQLNFGFRKTEQPCNYIIGINILIKGNDIIHNYKISSVDFKYKKFIREQVRAQMNYKNKDICLIKSLGVNKNFHNYIVILERYSKKHKQYKNVINDITTNYKWKSVYDFYPNKELKQSEDEPCDNTLRNAYNYLYKNVNNISFTDKSKANNITVKEVYNILKDVI